MGGLPLPAQLFKDIHKVDNARRWLRNLQRGGLDIFCLDPRPGQCLQARIIVLDLTDAVVVLDKEGVTLLRVLPRRISQTLKKWRLTAIVLMTFMRRC